MKKLSLTPLIGCDIKNKDVEADMVVFGDQIYTANEGGEFVKAFAVKDGKFICVGTVEEVEQYVGANTTVYYSPFVMPSGIEAHAHFLLEQAFMQKCYIKAKNEDGTVKSKKDILKIIEEYAEDTGVLDDENGALFGYGYSQVFLMDENLKKLYNRDDLDNLWGGKYKDKPVYIAEESLHEAWVNTITLVNANIDLNNEGHDPVEGIGRDDDGIATGVLTNEATSYVLQRGFQRSICSEIGYQKVVKDTCAYLNSMGYTGHYDAWTNFDGTEELYKALKSVDKANDLTCFFTGSYSISDYEIRENGMSLYGILDKFKGIREEYKSKRFDPKFIKLFADGVLENGTGFLKEKYIDKYKSYGYGLQVWTQKIMDEIVEVANKYDFPVHVHTLGDASCSEAIHSFAKSAKKNEKRIRNSLGHCILIDDNDYELIKNNNIGVAINSGWLSAVGDGFDLYDHIIGPERAKKLYPADKLIQQGIKPAISTDRPCAEGPINIFDYMATIILGYDPRSGNQVPRRERSLSVKDAINMLTINGAWMANYENERGSIEVGKYADFVCADYSPFDCNPRVIHDIEVASTCFEGKFVYLNNNGKKAD